MGFVCSLDVVVGFGQKVGMGSVETLYEGKYLGIYKEGAWEFARRPNADACVGILPITDDGEVVLIEQFRVPVGKRVIEIPAGLVGDEVEFRGESLAATAGRELIEETGFRAGRVELLLASPTSAGMTPELTHLFVATDLVKVGDGGGVDGEDIAVHVVKVSEVDVFLSECEGRGLLVDFKIHACLYAAGVKGFLNFKK